MAHACFHGRKRVHTRLCSKNRTQGLTRRNRGVSDGGGITTKALTNAGFTVDTIVGNVVYTTAPNGMAETWAITTTALYPVEISVTGAASNCTLVSPATVWLEVGGSDSVDVVVTRDIAFGAASYTNTPATGNGTLTGDTTVTASGKTATLTIQLTAITDTAKPVTMEVNF